MSRNNRTDPTDSLIFLTNRVGRLLSNYIKRNSNTDLEGIFPHIGLLVDLWIKDGVQQHNLAMSVIKDKGTITRSLNVLERANLVLRVPDEQDGRKKRIYLTPKGWNMQAELMPQAMAAINAATDGVSREEMEICKRVLTQMYHNLKSLE